MIEAVVENKGKFEKFGSIDHFEYLVLDDFTVPFEDSDYVDLLRDRMQGRLDFIMKHSAENTLEALPGDVIQALSNIIQSLS